ncbi:hypothetical protein DPEC_G00049950 [Dallia pectoralis]|uniref:Uncharacterized protein n=1 Tax=Dallia pectoralis TaxID=75939 RepID=A0ACC2HBJ9_DALPE|nr:hypothetical protein DPEC_G00049950 [Dallia pectoralis]
MFASDLFLPGKNHRQECFGSTIPRSSSTDPFRTPAPAEQFWRHVSDQLFCRRKTKKRNTWLLSQDLSESGLSAAVSVGSSRVVTGQRLDV